MVGEVVDERVALQVEEHLHVALVPHADGQLGDVQLDPGLPLLLDDAGAQRTHVVLALDDGPEDAAEPSRKELHRAEHLAHRLGGRVRVERGHRAHVVEQAQRVYGGAVRRPAGADAVGAVEEHHGQHRHVEERLHALAIHFYALQQLIVRCGKEQARDGRQLDVEVPRRPRVLPAVRARAELADPLKQRERVGTHEALRHVHDRRGHGGVSVVVGRLLGHVAGEHGHQDLLLLHLLAAEAGEENLALRRLEPVQRVGERARAIGHGELHEVAVDEVANRRLRDGAGPRAGPRLRHSRLCHGTRRGGGGGGGGGREGGGGGGEDGGREGGGG
mmetsp:Transcript_40441/g.95269  ORF Transcript_40441/g.95269 Transcript_40441/m.95269 type:complete len:332 (+) Transcript_40441:938-1933(+)